MASHLRSNSSFLPVTILSLLLLLGFGAILLQTGCNPDRDSVSSRDRNNQPHYSNVDRNSENAPQLVIGSFNIKQFGRTKMSKPGVVSILVDVARRFDILAIQELRDKNDKKVIPEFLGLINADGSQYAAAVGPVQSYFANGKQSTYSEQTVFIYDTNKVALIAPAYAAEDRQKVMYRPPFVGHFRSVGINPAEAFQFVLMNVHVAPKRAHLEFEAMRDIISGIYANHQGEDDFILLGDLNEEPEMYQKYAWMNDQHAALPSRIKTNTNQNESYDNIVFDSVRTSEYLQQSGVLNLMSEYDLTLDDAQLVSDHMPVWAIFSSFEGPSAAITRGEQRVIR